MSLEGLRAAATEDGCVALSSASSKAFRDGQASRQGELDAARDLIRRAIQINKSEDAADVCSRLDQWATEATAYLHGETTT